MILQSFYRWSTDPSAKDLIFRTDNNHIPRKGDYILLEENVIYEVCEVIFLFAPKPYEEKLKLHYLSHVELYCLKRHR